MKRVTENNMRKFIELKKKYIAEKDKNILKQINDFIENVINKDKRYFSKLSKYGFTNEELRYCIY